ncbi:MAG: hypothetical protein H6609_18980 [Ignavibacteriales bacterium]|nr:hypothetical protein [Ignavibacteriales bacterium]
MYKSNILQFLFYLSIGTTLSAQTIYENDINVNKFLLRLNQKQIISLNESVFPISNDLIKINLNPNISNLTEIDIEEAAWYLEKYSLEIGNKSSILGELNLIEDNFKLRLKPIFGYGVSAVGDQNGYTKKVGAHLDAYFGENLGIMFEYLDTGEFGDNVDRTKLFTPNTGHFSKNSSNGIEFSDVRAQLNYNWTWGVISLKKDYNQWGHGRYGQLILSNKAASYPHIQLQLNPTKWLSLNYIHGWLNSLVIDSSKSFYYGRSEVEPRIFEEYKSKFIAANYISIMPNDWLTFSLGNSFIYSGDLRPEMFIPVMYYKVMDHNTGRGDKGDGNGIIYFDLGITYPKNYLFYATAIIDVLEIREILKGDWYTSWFGYTIGASAIDLGIQNSELRIEYTKTNPWLYENKYDLTNYKHLNYSLGHWIGQNADLFTIEYQYSFIRGMHISIMWQLFRKGDMKDIYYAYHEPENLDFLYGERRTENRVKLNIDYEPFHNVYLQAYWSYSDIKDEKVGRTQDFLLGNKNSFSLSLSYGMPF